MPGTGIGQTALDKTLLPCLLASSSLIDVQLPGCGLTYIPPELFTIANIQSINLSHNHLQGGVPSTFWQAQSLRRLELHAGEGSNDSSPSTPSPAFPGAAQEHELGLFPPPLPPSMGDTAPRLGLRHVNVSGCTLERLAPTLAALRDLQVLMAGRNPLRELPEELAQCTSLAVLDVLGCPLAAVPAALASRRGLELKTGLPDAILPWLYLGDATAAANLPGLQARGISRVLSLVQPAECLLHAGVDCLNVAVDDTPIARLGFATCPVPYFVRFALCPASEVPTPAALGLSHGSVGGMASLVEEPLDTAPVPAWVPPHLAKHAGVSFGERGLPPLHLHAHRADSQRGDGVLPALSDHPPPLLVHCHAGASRSATATIALIMALQQWPLVRAFKFVKSRRGVVQPNIGFCDQLLHFERTLLQAGILDAGAPEFAPPSSPGPSASEASFSNAVSAWPNSISMKQLVQQSAGNMSASVWNARYSKPAAAPKRHVDAGLKLRALVKTVAAARRFSAVRAAAQSTTHAAAAAAPAEPGELPPPAAGGGATEATPGKQTHGFQAISQHDPRSLSATHASSASEAAPPCSTAAVGASPATHRSWSVSTKWLSDDDAQRQGAVSPLPAASADGGAALAAALGQQLPTIRDGEEAASSSCSGSSPRRRPAGMAKRPSIDLSDWEESKGGDARTQHGSTWAGDDEDVLAQQARHNRTRYAPCVPRSAPPSLAALPTWAWRRLTAALPEQRRASAHGDLAPLRLSADVFGSSSSTPVPGVAATQSPFPELSRAPAAGSSSVPWRAGGDTDGGLQPMRPIMAAASAVSLADIPSNMRVEHHEKTEHVPRVLGIMSPGSNALHNPRHPHFRLHSNSDHEREPAAQADGSFQEVFPSYHASECKSPEVARSSLAPSNAGAFSPSDEAQSHHLVRRHSFGV